MNCSSKDVMIQNMERRGLIEGDLDLKGKPMSSRLYDYVSEMTRLAKSKYGVDMGPLFKMDSRVSDFSGKAKVKLVPNDPAFEAIDMSKTMEQNRVDTQIAKNNYNDVVKDNKVREEEGNYHINEEGDVTVPSNLPKISVKC